MTIHNADLNDLLSSVINIASDDDDLSYQDPYLTREQKKERQTNHPPINRVCEIVSEESQT